MEGQPPAPVERTSRWSQWFARLTAPQTRRVALLLVLVATAAFGGLDTVNKQVTPFKPGEEFNDGEYTVTVDRARLVDDLKGPTARPKPGMKYLGVVTILRNDGTVPGRLRDQLDLRDVKDGRVLRRLPLSRRFGDPKSRARGSPSNWCSPGRCRIRLHSRSSR